MTDQEIRMLQYKIAALNEQVKVLKVAYSAAYITGYNAGKEGKPNAYLDILKMDNVLPFKRKKID